MFIKTSVEPRTQKSTNLCQFIHNVMIFNYKDMILFIYVVEHQIYDVSCLEDEKKTA